MHSRLILLQLKQLEEIIEEKLLETDSGIHLSVLGVGITQLQN